MFNVIVLTIWTRNLISFQMSHCIDKIPWSCHRWKKVNSPQLINSNTTCYLSCRKTNYNNKAPLIKTQSRDFHMKTKLFRKILSCSWTHVKMWNLLSLLLETKIMLSTYLTLLNSLLRRTRPIESSHRITLNGLELL